MLQLVFPDLAGGANACSLIEAQQNFAECGVCESMFRGNVRAPLSSDSRDPAWRPLDPKRDPHLRWTSPDDHQKWHSVKDPMSHCLYYWSPAYWLNYRVAEQ